MDNDKQINVQVERARSLRRKSTFPERLLWGKIRAGQLCGLKFRRQHPVGNYVLDFYNDEHKLGIELDGRSHNERADYDRARQAAILKQGIRIIRFGNDDVIKDMNFVLTGVLKACGISVNRSPSPRPSPRTAMIGIESSLRGEGEESPNHSTHQ